MKPLTSPQFTFKASRMNGRLGGETAGLKENEKAGRVFLSSFPRFPNVPFLFLLGDRSRGPVPEKN